ncbi:MAG: SPOR domain-containing protein [Candidatus Binataceae bacterium]|nr:SPOR domain-containing protein [Candidatus Binataceae bacterium]
MRFEIRSGGIAAIVFAIAALSGTVFMLGLLAGYDVGRESQSSQAQVATAYPLETPPESAAAPATSAPPAAVSGTPAPATAAPSAPAVAEDGAAPETPSTIAKIAKPRYARAPARTAAAIAPTGGAIADETPPRAGEMTIPPSAAAPRGSAESSSDYTSADDSEASPPTAPTHRASPPAIASASPAVRRRPYNIQIQAVMDRNGAEVMVVRLQNLGYTPHIVSTQLSGQTWYKVEVGPYATQQEAAAAQQQLRTRYNGTYGGTSAAATPAD